MQFSIFAWDGIFFVLMARQILYISQNFYWIFFNAFASAPHPITFLIASALKKQSK